MKLRSSLLCLSLLLGAFAQLPPAGIRVSTWVREDIFAGLLVNDQERFAQGMSKIDSILAAEPKNAEALAWRAGGEFYLALRAHENGQSARYRELRSKSNETFAEAARQGASSQALAPVYSIRGGTHALFADRLPESERREAWKTVKENYSALATLQKEFFDKMPAHHRGEVLGGLAMAAQRLGDDDASARLQDLASRLAGTPYATRAKRWIDNPDSAGKSSLACQTCHEPGKLAAVQAAAK